jgi:hypothetical protein
MGGYGETPPTGSGWIIFLLWVVGKESSRGAAFWAGGYWKINTWKIKGEG